ncbi:hypothetical protein MKX03_006623 [Papaver bracteatum]|nr:hypothetical protein MKX03_006623 [Papaver bracteatum]
MEVCKIIEGHRYSKRLNERQITALLKVTCQRPHEREKYIMQTVHHNAYYEDPFAVLFSHNKLLKNYDPLKDNSLRGSFEWPFLKRP